MTNKPVAVIDTTVLIHLLRNNLLATQWLATQPTLAMTPISWMEVIYGAPGRNGQARSLTLLHQFDLIYLTPTDQAWAMQNLLTYRLSHGLSITDCLIASVCHRFQIPLYTHNVKDMLPLLGPTLVIQPY